MSFRQCRTGTYLRAPRIQRVKLGAARAMCPWHPAMRPWHPAMRPWHPAMRPWHPTMRPRHPADVKWHPAACNVTCLATDQWSAAGSGPI